MLKNYAILKKTLNCIFNHRCKQEHSWGKMFSSPNTTANNQIKQSLAIHSYGAAIYLGSYKKYKQKLLNQLSNLFKNKIK